MCKKSHCSKGCFIAPPSYWMILQSGRQLLGELAAQPASRDVLVRVWVRRRRQRCCGTLRPSCKSPDALISVLQHTLAIKRKGGLEWRGGKWDLRRQIFSCLCRRGAGERELRETLRGERIRCQSLHPIFPTLIAEGISCWGPVFVLLSKGGWTQEHV